MKSHKQKVREDIEKFHGQCWDQEELERDFEIIKVMSPICFVKRRSDGVKGTLLYRFRPILYYYFTEDR